MEREKQLSTITSTRARPTESDARHRLQEQSEEGGECSPTTTTTTMEPCHEKLKRRQHLDKNRSESNRNEQNRTEKPRNDPEKNKNTRQPLDGKHQHPALPAIGNKLSRSAEKHAQQTDRQTDRQAVVRLPSLLSTHQAAPAPHALRHPRLVPNKHVLQRVFSTSSALLRHAHRQTTPRACRSAPHSPISSSITALVGLPTAARGRPGRPPDGRD